jgi:sugar lactone lactonase YvrE
MSGQSRRHLSSFAFPFTLISLALVLAPLAFAPGCGSSGGGGGGAPGGDGGGSSSSSSGGSSGSSSGGSSSSGSSSGGDGGTCASPTATLSVVAGNGTLGEADGTGGPSGTSEFNSPFGIAVDSSGILYVSDWGSSAIRKIDTSGNVTTLATPASFPEPGDIVVGTGGTLYVISAAGLYELSASGTTTCLVGESDCGATTDMNHPLGVRRDSSGNFFIANTRDFDIVELTAAGVASTFAGKSGQEGMTDGPGASALFEQPTAMAIDDAQNLYVADYGYGAIRKISPAGDVTTIAGGGVGDVDGTGGDAGTARFMDPDGLVVDSAGNVYVADTGDGHIRKIDTAGNVTTVAGGTGSMLSAPWGIARKDDATYYVTDSSANRVLKLSLSCP